MPAAKKTRKTKAKSTSKWVSVKRAILAHRNPIAAAVIVLALCCVGYFGFVRSDAASFNASYKIGVNSELGCKLSGRVWNAQANKGKGDCKDACRYPKVQFARTDGTPKRGYCEGYVNLSMEPEHCIADLHRYYINEIGCSRRAAQENTNDAPQCIPNYPNYIAEANTDKCVAQTIVRAQTGSGAGQVGSGTPSGVPAPTTPTPTPQPSPNPSQPTPSPALVDPPATNTANDCKLLGRQWDSKKRVCKAVCESEAGPLLVGLKSGVKYCRGAVAVTLQGNEQRCVNGLHRVWLVEGCARRADQVDATRTNKEPLLQCQPGFDFYNANFNNRAEDNQTLTDVCEKSEAVAKANEKGGTPGDINTPPVNTPTDEDTQPTNPEDTPEPQPEQPTSPGQPTNQTLDYDMDRDACHVRGRSYVYVPARRDSARGGCSRQECLDSSAKVLKTADNGRYCPGYVNRNMSSEKCGQVHRLWLNDVKGCALRPVTGKKKVVVGAIQCDWDYPVYIYHKADEGTDECLKRSTFQTVQSVAQKVGKPVAVVASWSKARICAVRGLEMRDGKCKHPTTSANPSEAKGGKITAIQFNVYVGHPISEYRVDMNKLLDHNPDVLTLNEAYRLSKNDMSMRGYRSWRSADNRDQLETPVMWRDDKWKPIDRGTILVSRSNLKWGTRYANWITLENRNNSKQVFTVVSAHTIPGALAGPARMNVLRQSVENLNVLIARQKTAGPVIVGGDFNIDYHADRNSNHQGLPYRGFKVTNTASTFELLGEPDSGWGTGDHAAKADIDYLFMTKNMGLKAERHTVIRGLYSDHNALLAIFNFDGK